MKSLAIVIPCFNEEECLPSSADILHQKLMSLIGREQISPTSKLVFVDDGSTDSTWSIIVSLHQKNSQVIGIKLSRNEGHQYALLAGLDYAVPRYDMTITIDADLQDDVNVIDTMVQSSNNGFDVVNGVRTSRKKDTFFKRKSASAYYHFMAKMGIEVVNESADFRLLSQRAGKALLSYREGNLFLRGLVPLVGFPTTNVGYERLSRKEGKSKYSLKKMLSLAENGICSFSEKPLHIIVSFGFFLSDISILAMIVFGVLYATQILEYHDIAFILGSIFLATGILLQAMGILGVYVGKINVEVKKRPAYFIQEILR